jgi:hypothetical protein
VRTLPFTNVSFGQHDSRCDYKPPVGGKAVFLPQASPAYSYFYFSSFHFPNIFTNHGIFCATIQTVFVGVPKFSRLVNVQARFQTHGTPHTLLLFPEGRKQNGIKTKNCRRL